MTKQVTIHGLTESTIMFNVIGGSLVGESTRVVDLTNSDKEEEIRELTQAGMISVEYPDEISEEEVAEKQDANLAVNVRTNRFPEPVHQTVKNPLEVTERTGSEAVIVTDKGVKAGKARRSYIPEAPQVSELEDKISKGAQASLDAMKQLEDEEAESIARMGDRPDDSHLDPSERMGERAVVGTGTGGNRDVNLTTSAIEGQDAIHDQDAFVDREENAEREALVDSKDAFINPDSDSDKEHSEAFIEK